MKTIMPVWSALLIILFSACGAFAQSEAAAPWLPLFNGSDLSGWVQRNGDAEYRVVDDMIVGISKRNTPNSFLCTERAYSDFILEYEFKVDEQLNSGVQVRSLSMPEFQNGRVHGLQVEIDTSPRAWTGGIYDEARRGWLYSLSRNEAGRQAFRHGEWNTVRVEAIGTSIEVWVNDVQTARLADKLTMSGFIALQVHSIGDDSDREGLTVSWRNLRIMTEDLQSYEWAPDPFVDEFNFIPNTLTEWERRQGWRLLWDGETTAGWRGARLDEFPEVGWRIEDGVLTVLESGGGEAAHGGDIVTLDKFSEFELVLDFSLTEGANSGIKYFVDPELNMGPGSSIGLEYQLLDDRRHPDAAQGVSGNRTLASLYDLIPAENLTLPERGKRFNGIGQWNRARIVVDGMKVEHWLNNEKTVEYERGSQIYRALVQKSKYVDWPNFGQSKSGQILLQDHGNEVHFRSIKIREL